MRCVFVLAACVSCAGFGLPDWLRAPPQTLRRDRFATPSFLHPESGVGDAELRRQSQRLGAALQELWACSKEISASILARAPWDPRSALSSSSSVAAHLDMLLATSGDDRCIELAELNHEIVATEKTIRRIRDELDRLNDQAWDAHAAGCDGNAMDKIMTTVEALQREEQEHVKKNDKLYEKMYDLKTTEELQNDMRSLEEYALQGNYLHPEVTEVIKRSLERGGHTKLLLDLIDIQAGLPVGTRAGLHDAYKATSV
mmetsp:Transcript_6839/g.13667  ORF Transcript_6839/g.13667 Transcript_6839/m.13667 type:complete len:257 (+) Transcript_6839:50-820(+)